MLSAHKHRIFIVDDHFLIPQGISSLLDEEGNFEVSGVSNDPSEVLAMLKKSRTDILLTDISMPQMSGIELTRQVLNKYPKIRVLALSMLCEPATVRQMLDVGVSGYILKDTTKEEIVLALNTIANGGQYFSAEVQQAIARVSSMIRFTEREIEIIKLIAREHSSREIADQLTISERTVETHRSNLLRKASATNTAGLLQYVYQHNII
jgi:two-component system nitrate/nitrite response regulator NarL